MKEYKYSYQDWVEGTLESNDTFQLYIKRYFSTEEFGKLALEQSTAYTRYLYISFEALKQDFIADYKKAIVRHKYLESKIEDVKGYIDKVQTEHVNVGHEILYEHTDGRYTLTKKQVDEYNACQLNDEFVQLTSFDMAIGNFNDEPIVNYILLSNFCQWLIWFKEQESPSKVEPGISYSSDDTYERSIKQAASIFKERHISYTWLNNPDEELPELYKLLMENRLIHPDTTESQLEAVFSGKPLQPVQPIRWHDDNASELLYFILQLEDSDNILKSSRTNYERLKACFVKPDGKPFDTNLRQAKNNIKKYGIAKEKQQVIDSIIKDTL